MTHIAFSTVHCTHILLFVVKIFLLELFKNTSTQNIDTNILQRKMWIMVYVFCEPILGIARPFLRILEIAQK